MRRASMLIGPSAFAEVTVLQTTRSDESYAGQASGGSNYQAGLNLRDYFNILKERFFYFIFPFGLISVVGLYLAALQEPSYLSEGKILVEAQLIAPDIVRPISSATANERV